MICYSLKVIPVAIGTDANPNELEKATTNRKNLVTSPKDEEPKSLGKKIMNTVVKGDVLSILLTDDHKFSLMQVLTIWWNIKKIR